jgi:hypothetical protein
LKGKRLGLELEFAEHLLHPIRVEKCIQCEGDYFPESETTAKAISS